MLTLQIDQTTKDLHIDPTSKVPVLIDGKTCLRQRLQNRLALFLGEWILDKTSGMDWLNLYQSKNQNSIKRAIQTELLKDAEVTSIDSITLKLIETDEDVRLYNKPKRTLVVSELLIGSVYGSVSV
jgi:hypothetical protein